MNINYVDIENQEMAQQFCSSGRQRIYVTVVCTITLHMVGVFNKKHILIPLPSSCLQIQHMVHISSLFCVP
jgi:hypothetical protein